MGTNYYAVSKKPTVNEPIHIGKSSGGWKFLFRKVDRFDNWITETALDSVEKWKEFLLNKDVVIMNEYNEIVPYKEFWQKVEEKQKENNPNDFTYDENIDGYRFFGGDFC